MKEYGADIADRLWSTGADTAIDRANAPSADSSAHGEMDEERMIAFPVTAIVGGAAATYVTCTLVAGRFARKGFPLPPAEKRIGCINGLRGYLALSVLIHHFIVSLQVARLDGRWTYPPINVFNELGAGSVLLFFMTTGFVFYPRVLQGFRSSPWVAIFVTRVLRIMPMVVVSVALVVVLIALRTGRTPHRDDLFAAAVWVSTWGEPPLLAYPSSGQVNAYVLWSLWYEWLFYFFVLPLCAVVTDVLRGRPSTWFAPLMLGVGSIALHIFGLTWPLLSFLPVFAVGMLAYEVQHRAWIANMLRGPAAAVVAVAALIGAAMISNLPNNLTLPLFGFFFTCVACGNTIGGILNTRGALVLGECSYSVYVIHGIFLSIFFVDMSTLTMGISTNVLPLLLPAVAMPVLLVTISTYLGIERPGIALGRRLAGALTGFRFRRDAAQQEVAP